MPRKPTGRPPGRPKGMPAFARLVRTREALQKKADTYVKLHEKAAKVAASKGNSAPAEWALSHIAAVDEQGKEVRPIASGIDRQQIEKGNGAPVINIGFLTAPAPQKQLGAANVQVIDVTPDRAESE